MLLQGKTAVISGAASRRGIGLATARLFAAQGAKVAILDLDLNAAHEAAVSLGEDHLGLRCDVTDSEACRSAVSVALSKFGVIDSHQQCRHNTAGKDLRDRCQELAPHPRR